MLEEVKKVSANAELIYDTDALEQAIDIMATAINQRMANLKPHVLCAMNGGVVLAGKLLGKLTMPLTFDAMNATRYNSTTSGSQIKWLLKPQHALQGRNVLILDDILDVGITLKAMRDYCLEHGAEQVYTAVLLDKKLNMDKPIQADFVGLPVVDRYLFGYGMDYKGYLRNANGIFACKEEDL